MEKSSSGSAEAKEMIDPADEQAIPHRHRGGGDSFAHRILRHHLHAGVADFHDGDDPVFAGAVEMVTGENGR
jgi:hypothetical protein